MSPTQRSLQQLKHLGYHARVVERWNPFVRRREDLWSMDLLALKIGRVSRCR